MWAHYDEDISQNEFFKEIKLHHEDILKKSAEENWIICVPRSGSLKSDEYGIDTVLDHILVRQENGSFITLSKKDIYLENRHLKLEKNSIFENTVEVLFEETHYVKEVEKYIVWCIERPLFSSLKPCGLGNNNNTIVLLCTQDCIDFLYSETSGHDILQNIQKLCAKFWKSHEDIFELETFQCQKDFIGNLYSQCLQLLYKSDFMREKCEGDADVLENYKIAIESCMQYCLGKKLIYSLNSIKHFNDSILNKIIRNSLDISLKDLNIPDYFNDLILNASYEISRINNFVTVLDKLNCLAKTFKTFSKHSNIGDRKVYLTSDDFLQILVYLILKSNIPNWVANLSFLKEFNFTTIKNSDQNSFLVTSLEAAIEFIKSNQFLEILNNKKCFDGDHNEDSHFYFVYSRMKTDMRTRFLDMFNIEKFHNSNEKIELCHPLCTCQRCIERTIKKSNENSYKLLNKSDQNFFILACIENDVNLLEFLFSLDFDINFKDVFGKTALHYAAEKGFQDILLLLVNSGADVNVLDNDRNTPLHLASDKGHDNCVKALIYSSAGVEMNLQNSSGETPLFLATRWSYFDIIKILLENGASVCVKNNRNVTVYKLSPNFHISKLFQQFGSIKSNFILGEAFECSKIRSTANSSRVTDDVNSLNSWRERECDKTNEFLCCKPRNFPESKRIELLLKTIENNDLPLTYFYLGYTSSSVVADNQRKKCHPLCNCMQCISTDNKSNEDINLDCIVGEKSCVGKIFNINACNSEGYSAVHIAAKFGRTEILRILLDSGASLNIRTWGKLYTPLHLAVIFERVQSVKEMLKCGECQVDCQDYKGNTALYYACVKNNSKIVEILLQNRADCQVRNNEGKTIWQVCEERNLFRICRMLRENVGYFVQNNSGFSEYAFSNIDSGLEII